MRQSVLVSVVIVCALLGAASAHAETTSATSAAVEKDGLIYKGGVVMMAPIPNDAPAAATAEPVEIDAGGVQAGAKHCLATAIYFEARGETLKGQKAVGEVIMKRTRQAGRPKTVCGVVYEGSERRTGCQFSFTCDGIADKVRDGSAWARAQKAAAAVLRSGGRGKFSRGATHYHASYVTPYWASSMVKVARIGTHIFYRD